MLNVVAREPVVDGFLRYRKALVAVGSETSRTSTTPQCPSWNYPGSDEYLEPGTVGSLDTGCRGAALGNLISSVRRTGS